MFAFSLPESPASNDASDVDVDVALDIGSTLHDLLEGKSNHSICIEG